MAPIAIGIVYYCVGSSSDIVIDDLFVRLLSGQAGFKLTFRWSAGVAVFSLGNILNFISFGYAAQVALCTCMPCIGCSSLCLSSVFIGT